MSYIAIEGHIGNGYKFSGPYESAVQAAQAAGEGFAARLQSGDGYSGDMRQLAEKVQREGKACFVLVAGELGQKATFYGPFGSIEHVRAHGAWLCAPWVPATLECAKV